jgi:hypothetical protein
MLVEPALDRVENGFMLPPGDPSLLGGGAAGLEVFAVSACETD